PISSLPYIGKKQNKLLRLINLIRTSASQESTPSKGFSGCNLSALYLYVYLKIDNWNILPTFMRQTFLEMCYQTCIPSFSFKNQLYLTYGEFNFHSCMETTIYNLLSLIPKPQLQHDPGSHSEFCDKWSNVTDK